MTPEIGPRRSWTIIRVSSSRARARAALPRPRLTASASASARSTSEVLEGARPRALEDGDTERPAEVPERNRDAAPASGLGRRHRPGLRRAGWSRSRSALPRIPSSIRGRGSGRPSVRPVERGSARPRPGSRRRRDARRRPRERASAASATISFASVRRAEISRTWLRSSCPRVARWRASAIWALRRASAIWAVVDSSRRRCSSPKWPGLG